MNKNIGKLSFEELAKQADLITSEDLLNTIAGGNSVQTGDLSACHLDSCHAATAGA
ncbi:MAG: hypothetical protein JWQ63_1483 [Mucilaginibacter sp.]|nr:hypothetical protein [Mucilaginibacter sp.]